MPTPAPRSPERLKLVSRLSVLIWVPVAVFLIEILKMLPFYQPLGRRGLLLFAVTFGLMITVYLYLNWLYANWLNALVQNKTRVSLERSARTLRTWLVVPMVFVVLVSLGGIYSLYMTLSKGSLGTQLAQSLLQLVSNGLLFVVCGSFRTWLKVGYSTAIWTQRLRLVTSLWLYVASTLLLFLFQQIAPTPIGSTERTAVDTVLGVVTLAVSLYSVSLMTRLVNLTFGTSGDPPKDGVSVVV